MKETSSEYERRVREHGDYPDKSLTPATMLGGDVVEIAAMLGICSVNRAYTGGQVLQLAQDIKSELRRIGLAK